MSLISKILLFKANRRKARIAKREGRCSFCGIPSTDSEVFLMIEGDGKTFICDNCVRLCQKVITERRVAQIIAAQGNSAVVGITDGDLD